MSSENCVVDELPVWGLVSSTGELQMCVLAVRGPVARGYNDALECCGAMIVVS